MNSNNNVNTEEYTVATVLARNWWLLALRGLLTVIFGVLAFIWPGITLLTLVFLFATYAIVNGILSLIVAFKAPKGARLGSLIVGGILGIIAGILAFILPGVTALGLVLLVAGWAIVTGVMEVIAAIRLRKEITNEWLLALAGLCSIAFGVTALLLPGVGALALVWWIGAYAVALGILLIVLAFRMRHWTKLNAVNPGIA